ncbi:hypothetical protein GCM10023219_01970 [Stakelama sediminis]|uniref:Uncharacterized protein n=1 Tax=Stakelama sediminis TaxID=463200 RepID=A0A840Z0E2_9SPHN|nr:hypothetical protein [Stakelama sediminis]
MFIEGLISAPPTITGAGVGLGVGVGDGAGVEEPAVLVDPISELALVVVEHAARLTDAASAANRMVGFFNINFSISSV